MESTDENENGESYPSRLVGAFIESNVVNAPPQSSPQSPRAAVDSVSGIQKRAASSLEDSDASPSEQKRQRIQTRDKLREDAQRRLMDAINTEAQKIHGEGVQVFPEHLLQSSFKPANDTPTPTQRRGRGRPRKVKPPGGDPHPRLASIPSSSIPKDGQQQQNICAIAESSSRKNVAHSTKKYPGPPSPSLGGVPQYPLPRFALSTSDRDQQPQDLPATSAFHSHQLSVTQDRQLSGPLAFNSGGPSQIPQPNFPTTISQIQTHAAIATQALQGSSHQLAQLNDGASVSIDGIIRYPHPTYIPTARQISQRRAQSARPDPETPAPASRRASRTVNSSANLTSHSRTAGVNTKHQQPAQLPVDTSPLPTNQPQAQQLAPPAQPVFGAQIPRIGGVQPPQLPYFAQSLDNNPNRTANTPQSTITPEHRAANQALVDPMEYLAITDGASKAWAAHQHATTLQSRHPFPPPQDSEDVRHAGGRTFHSWAPGKVVYLSVSLNDGADPNVSTMLHFPIDWDLAFYHSRRLAWFYSENTGNNPIDACPIQICFAATGYTLMNWMFKQIIFPLPLFGQTPLFPHQSIPDEQTILVDLWICAFDLQIPKLQNLALQELDRIRNSTGQMNIQALIHVYTHTPIGSLLRQYMTWQYATRLNERFIAQARDWYPREFLMDWIMMLTQICKSRFGTNDVAVNLTLEDFMVREMKVEWPFGEMDKQM
ncbi:hypothetical protein BKA65DRAFT_124341 [Rhexocercosporidium sp. MPI-PUGE-AT-0058]|nr:hypothetical protein BKA65DRAFT_124341 [Rhexocercosporidium sp. MPI-PUGE-AT-0058]